MKNTTISFCCVKVEIVSVTIGSLSSKTCGLKRCVICNSQMSSSKICSFEPGILKHMVKGNTKQIVAWTMVAANIL